MREQLEFMPHLSTLMLTINLVSKNVLTILRFGNERLNVLFCCLCNMHLSLILVTEFTYNVCLMHFPSSVFVNPAFIVVSGVEAGKKAAGEVLALQKRVLAVLNEARYDVNYKQSKLFLCIGSEMRRCCYALVMFWRKILYFHKKKDRGNLLQNKICHLRTSLY